MFVPTMLRPLNDEAEESAVPGGIVVSASDPAGHLLDGNQLVITLLGYLGLLLTFGAVFPPLAVAFTVTLVAVTLYAKLRVGRFLTIAEALQRLALVRGLEDELRGRHATEVLQYGLWMLLTASCLFYTLFLFDTLGDSVGFNGAYWVLIVFPLLPMVCFMCTKAAGRLFLAREPSVPERRDRKHLTSDDMEMSTGSNLPVETYNVLTK